MQADRALLVGRADRVGSGGAIGHRQHAMATIVSNLRVLAQGLERVRAAFGGKPIHGQQRSTGVLP